MTSTSVSIRADDREFVTTPETLKQYPESALCKFWEGHSKNSKILMWFGSSIWADVDAESMAYIINYMRGYRLVSESRRTKSNI